MNNNFGISDKSYDLLLKTLACFQSIDRAVIFGSRAKGNFKKGSDIDIAIYGKNLQDDVALQLTSKVNEDTPIPYSTDVVAPKYLDNPNLLDHIGRVGIVFYEK